MNPRARSITLGILVLVALPNARAAQLIDRVEASVNASPILHSDIVNFRRILPLRGQLDPLFAGTPIAQKGPAVTDAEAVDYLINDKLIALTFPTGDAEVEQEILSIQTANRIDRAQLRSALAEQGFSFEEYFELIRSSASKKALIEREIRTKVAVSDDDVKNEFYNRSGSQSSTRAYRVQLITTSTRTFKNLNAAREALQRALTALKSGEAFDEVARRVSDAPNASAGGDLGVLAEDQMSPAIRDQVKKLKIGEVSPIFSSGDSLTIVKLVDIQSEESSVFDKKKEEIRARLYAAEYQGQIQLWLDRQMQNAFIHKVGASASK